MAKPASAHRNLRSWQDIARQRRRPQPPPGSRAPRGSSATHTRPPWEFRS